MAEASGSNDGGVGGVGGVSGSSGASASAASSAAADAQASTTESVAAGLVDAATGPAGVDVGALGAAVAGLQAQVNDTAAQALQAAVESQLSPVDAGQLQAAIDAAAPGVTSPVQAALASPLAGIEAPQGLFNAKGQMIDTCGNVVSQMSVDRSVPFDQTDYAKAVTNLERATAGPISGPVYTAAWASGASPSKLDAVADIGKVLDGALGVQKNRASRPSFQMQAPTPAGWNQTQR
jgi:hypothetical protein